MEQQRMPEMIVALFNDLPVVTEAMARLEERGVPYSDIRLRTYPNQDDDMSSLPPGLPSLAEQVWMLQVVVEFPGVFRAEELLREHMPLAIGRCLAPNRGRSDTELGALSWRHHVFASSTASDQVGESAGTTGLTGITTSGVFADDAVTTGNVPVRGLRGSEGRPPLRHQNPADEQLHPTTVTDKERPDTELHPD
jgi:hypothetical protein